MNSSKICISAVLAILLGLLGYLYTRNYGPELLATAASSGDVRMMWILLNAGVDINGRGRNVNIPIVNAASAGRTEAVKFLLDHGADPNVPEKVHFTALMAAVQRGHFETAKLLLSAGADANEVGDNGTALSIANSRGDMEMVHLLTEPK